MAIAGALRPRSNTEILDASFALARRLGTQLLPISLLIGLPISALAYRFSSLTGHGLAHLGSQLWAALGLMLLGPVLESLRVWVLEAAMIEAITRQEEGDAVRWPAVRSRLGSVFWRLVGSQAALIMLGSLFSIPAVVPGVIYFLHRLFYSEVLLAEGPSVRSSFRRSFALTDGRLGRLGLLVLAGSLLLAALSWGFSLWAGKYVLGAALGWMGTGCISLFKAALYVLAYYDLRARREGIDLLARDAALEARASAPPSPA